MGDMTSVDLYMNAVIICLVFHEDRSGVNTSKPQHRPTTRTTLTPTLTTNTGIPTTTMTDNNIDDDGSDSMTIW